MNKEVLGFLSLFLGVWSYAQGISFKNVTESHLPLIAKAPNNSMDAKTGDIDGDGDLDIVIGVEFKKNVILINDGRGNFIDGSERLPDIQSYGKIKPYPYYPYHDTEDVALEDFDNDGDLDIIFVTEDDLINEYYLNDGTGHFSSNTANFPVSGISNGILAGDFDKDGWVDLIIGNKGQNVYLKNNKGTFINETYSRIPTLDDITQDLQAIDFDKDGDLDVVVANEKENKLLFNDGSGKFTDRSHLYFETEFLKEETREATFADIDNDGSYDLFFANVFMFQQVVPVQRLLINSGTDKKFKDETKERLGITSEHSMIDAVFADMDNDGDVDLITVTYESPLIFLNDGHGFFEDITLKTLGSIPCGGVDIEVADYNADEKKDLYISCFRGSDILLLQN